MGTTEQVAKFVAETPGEAIPPEAIEWAKIGMLDCMGTTLAGSRRPLGKIINELVSELGGAPRSVVVGGGYRTSPTNAALANGTMAHALDYDDGGGGFGHASVVLWPAILSLGDELKVSGREAIEAYVIGFELAANLAGGGLVRSRETQINGFHSTALYGVMSAVGAASRLLKLDSQQTRMALGIAGSWTGGLLKNIGSMTKPLHAGRACMSGILAALLAKKGFTADANIIEAPAGFAFAFWHPGNYDLDKITQDLGKEWKIISQPLGIKPYPSCRHNHSALDALLGLMEEHKFTYDQVENVEMGLKSIPPFFYRKPVEEEQAKFSFDYNLAATIRDGKPVRETFDDDVVNSPRMQEALKKVTVTEHPEWTPEEEAKGDTVAVKLTDGRTLSARVAMLKGNAGNPLTPEELAGKYTDNALQVLDDNGAKRSLEMLQNLGQVGSVSELADIVIGDGRR